MSTKKAGKITQWVKKIVLLRFKADTIAHTLHQSMPSFNIPYEQYITPQKYCFWGVRRAHTP
jgi:hypothetical protein